ncbi:GNAT family N-acetyltransferase [Synechocystis sp. CACIAM 05]|uniref:GNAT family N-acetyltransferase n=1 Tax=Synechocystis sp. CACIAM 05 TaxID=1933929 RepID=UPI001EFF9071|nr:GNAT family N-acetyltransferase [Synechocystis sp. CACIAM 05]
MQNISQPKIGNFRPKVAKVNTINLRPYQPSDLNNIIQIFTKAVHQLGITYYSPAQLTAWAPSEPDLQRWRDRLEAMVVLVAEQGTTIIGFIGYDGAGLVDLLFVHPAFARLGIATMLMQAVEQLAIADGVRELKTKASMVARPFFESRGFVVIAEETVNIGGENLRRFAMGKTIEPTH